MAHPKRSIAIRKSAYVERIKENFDVIDFELTAEDMTVIKSFRSRERNFL